MRSSTSSSRAPEGPWRRTWLLAAVLAGLTFGLWEWAWSRAGHRPTVSDTFALWSLERARAIAKPNTLVTVGASRLQLGFDSETFRSRFPNWTLARLEVAGKAPVATLEDLAEDTDFRGVALVSASAATLRASRRDDQATRVRYYRRGQPGPAEAVDARLMSWLQDKLVTLSPALRWQWVVPLLLRGHDVKPAHTVMRQDRSRAADYLGSPNLATIRRGRLAELNGRTRADPEAWLRAALGITEPAVRAIQERGGRVAFIRMPTCDEHWLATQRSTPKSRFWDRFAAETSAAAAIHFADHPGLTGFQCPDTSHLDMRDAPRFTESLLSVLTEKRVFRAPRVGGT